MAAEGYGARARRLDPVANLASRRNDLRAAAARLLVQDAEKSVACRAVPGDFRSREERQTVHRRVARFVGAENQGGEGELTLGQPIAASDVFKVGDQVDVTGISKGHGYAGVIKRHHFSGFPGSHGTHEYFRHGGSIGNRSYPGRVRKGMRMAGQMGNATASILNLEVLEILTDDNAVVISGAVPGPDGALLVVHHAARPRRRANVKVTVSA